MKTIKPDFQLLKTIFDNAHALIKKYPNFNLKASLGVTIEPDVRVQDKRNLTIQLYPLSFTGRVHTLDDVPYRLVESVEELHTLALDPDINPMFDDRFFNTDITFRTDDYVEMGDYDFDTELYIDFYHHSDAALTTLPIELSIQEANVIREFNGEILSFRLVITDSGVDIEDTDKTIVNLIRSSRELLDFYNLFAKKKLKMKPLPPSQNPQATIDNSIQALKELPYHIHVYKSELTDGQAYQTTDAWLHFDTNKSDRAHSGIIFDNRGISIHSHMVHPVRSDYPFTMKVRTKDFWLRGYFKEVSKQSSYHYSQHYTNNDTFNHAKTLLEHFFIDSVGSDNFNGKTNCGSGASIDINITDILTLPLEDMEMNTSGGVYVVHYNQRIVALFNLEFDVNTTTLFENFKTFANAVKN